MADTSIKISLELADAAAQKALSDFVTNAGKADQSFKKLGDSGNSTFTQIGLAIGKASGIWEIFEGNLAANLATEAFNGIVESAEKLFEIFGVEGVKAAEESQNAIQALNQALASSGQYTKEASEDFQAFAEQLQKNSSFSKEVITQNAAMIESLARLDGDGLKRATQAAADLAAGLGKDFPSAAELVAKAADGNVQAFTRLGITIHEGQTSAETFANALQQIEAHFGGDAASQVQTYSGALDQTGNSFRELQESFGNIIVQNPTVIATIKAVGESFTQLAAFVKNNSDIIKEYVGLGLITFINTMKFVVEEIDLSVRVFQTLYGVLQSLTIPILPITVAIRAMSVGFKQAGDEAIKFVDNAGKNLGALGKDGNGALKQISDGLGKIGDSALTGFAQMKLGADGTVEPINNATEATKKLTDAQKLEQQQADALAKSLIKNSNDGKDEYTQQTAIAKSQAAEQIANNKTLLEKLEIDNTTFATRKATIEKQLAAQELAAQRKQITDQQAVLDKAHDDGLLKDDEYYAATDALRQKDVALTAKAAQDAVTLDAQQKSELQAANDKDFNNRVNTLNALSALQNSKSKEMAEVGKAAAMVNIGIATYEGAIKAYDSMAGIPIVGPALGIAAAAAITAYGVEQEANLAGLSFAQGGIVPGTSYTGDNISANVNSGEMILNANQQRNLFDIANGSPSRRGNDPQMQQQNTLLAGILTALQGGQRISINGKEIFQVLRDGQRSGMSFA